MSSKQEVEQPNLGLLIPDFVVVLGIQLEDLLVLLQDGGEEGTVVGFGGGLGRDERGRERVAEVEDEGGEDFDLLGDDGSCAGASVDLRERREEEGGKVRMSEEDATRKSGVAERDAKERESTYAVAHHPGQLTLPDPKEDILCDFWLISDETSDVRAVVAVIHQGWVSEERLEGFGGFDHDLESKEVGVDLHELG